MKNAWGVTGIMGLIAAGLAIAAMVVYPRVDQVVSDELVNQTLFTDLAVDQVRAIAITSFDRENLRFESVQLQRVRDNWIIPSAGDYPAGNAERRAAILDALSQTRILEVKSSDESTHQLYGVVDADAVNETSQQSGIGTKVSLVDNNNRSLAELIIGEAVSNNRDQRFVRIAGQPNVYVIAWPASLLSTKLTDWVDHNLLDLKLDPAGSGLDVAGIQIDNYILDGDKITGSTPQKYNFKASIDLRNNALPLSLQKAQADGTLGEATTDKSLQRQALAALAREVAQVPFSAVGKKPAAAAQALASGDAAADYQSLSEFGIRKAENGADGFDSKNGELVVSTVQGIEWTLHFGSAAANADASDTSINYYLMITARVNEAAFPQPPQPADPSNEDQQKEFERAVKRRDENLAAMSEQAKQYNQRHAPWLYLISEDSLQTLRPGESELVQ